jgi:hypothetical protein
VIYSEEFRQKLVEFLRLHRAGNSINYCCERVGITRQTARSLLDNPDRFDPDIDEVAIERVIDGHDAKVWNNMTEWERREIWRILGTRYGIQSGREIGREFAETFGMAVDGIRRRLESDRADPGLLRGEVQPEPAH